MHNQVHLMCLTCSDLICDKCLIDEHENHQIEDFKIALNTDFVVNIMTNFYQHLKGSNEEQLKSFKDKISDVDKMIGNFFNEEINRVEKITSESIDLLKNLNGKIKKLIAMYQQKFKEELLNIREDHEKFQDEIVARIIIILILVQSKINFIKSNNISSIAKIKEFKEFKFKKKTLETDFKRILSFYDFNKSALISEFSMKEFHSYIEKQKIYLNKHYEEYSKLIVNININDKINQVVGFDESQMLFSSKNYIPRNLYTIYQPIDRTNGIIIYDAESEKFKRISLNPRRLNGFSFLPFSRYINFNGRLFVSGGYEDSKLSRNLWAIEDKNNFDLTDGPKSSNGKFSNANNVNFQFYSSINEKNFLYEDENLMNIQLIKCADMIYSRAGHSMVGLSPSLILAFSGTEGNKTCEMFHFDTNKWEEISSLNEPRIDPSAYIHKNYIYIFFGLKYDKLTKKFKFLDTIERISLLNMQKAEWEYITPKFSSSFNKENLPRSLCGLVVKNNSNSIYICGGQVDKEKYSNDVYEYNLESNIISNTDKKLPKPSGFIEQNFSYLFKTGLNFDIYGDVFYYHHNDSFNFIFQKLN